MNVPRQLSACRARMPVGARTAAALIAGTLLVAACGATPPPTDEPPPNDPPNDDDWGHASPPAHFVLSITPAARDLPLPTTTAPQPTTTIDLPEPTTPKPTETIPREPTTVLPPETTIPPPETTIPPTDPTVRLDRVVLACNPDAGTHPDPQGACHELREVKGDFARLEPVGQAGCDDVLDPVVVEAIGYWGEQRVAYTEWFENPCSAAVATGNVFRFGPDTPADQE